MGVDMTILPDGGVYQMDVRATPPDTFNARLGLSSSTMRIRVLNM